MKIKYLSLKRTKFAFPSEWEGITSENDKVRIHYRYGKISIFLNGVLNCETDKDELDVGGYLSDEDLQLVLIRDKLLEKEK